MKNGFDLDKKKTYPNGIAIMKVITGTMLMKALANVADVF